MPILRRPSRLIALLLLAGLAIAPGHLAAQDRDPPKEDDGSVDPDAEEDPGSDVDPSLIDVSKSTLGMDVEPYFGDPDLLSTTEDPYDLGDPEVSVTLDPIPAPRNCAAYTQTVTPIAVDTTLKHYFVKDGGPRILAGSSADVGCHLYLTSNLMCRYGSVPPVATSAGQNFKAVLDNAESRGFNKIRVWVALVNESLPENVPFARVNGYWDLNTPNDAYFNRLLEIVNYAHARKHVVEVTFFAPFQGGDFTTGAWTRKPRAGGNEIGFSKEQAFVVANDARLAQADRNMLAYQKNVIDWTVKKLWCYENLVWEIANEPGAISKDKDNNNRDIIGDPVAVAAWEKKMIEYVRLAEAGPPARPKHAIAVQPFSTDELAQFTGSNRPAGVINGHYTTANSNQLPVFPAGVAKTLDQGAIRIIRENTQIPVVFGFNETKITPLGGGAGTRSHLNGAVGPNQLGTNEPARAEALEFLLNQGSIYEHWGYLGKDGSSPVSPYNTSPMRAYISKLLNFFNTRRFDLSIALTDYKTMPIEPNNSAWNAWFRPGAYAAWEPATVSRKHWAALTTKPNVPQRVLLYYVHHSTPRCQANFDYFQSLSQTPPPPPTCQRIINPANPPVPGPFLVYNSYDARIWTTQGTRYQEHLTMLTPGNYDVTWIDPETLQSVASTTNQPICLGCVLHSPEYKFDIILKLVKR